MVHPFEILLLGDQVLVEPIAAAAFSRKPHPRDPRNAFLVAFDPNDTSVFTRIGVISKN